MNTQIPFDMNTVEAIIALHKALPGAVLPVLHGTREQVGHIPSHAVPLIYHRLGAS
ncbi:MAG: hypothetical protein HHJ09_12580 [Glaciimonas sp.]|nr:hypothetical protein [Glaciimonas sp.]